MNRVPFAVAALALAACAGSFSDRERLINAVREVNDGVRWNRIEMAVVHLPPSDRRRFADRHAALGDDLEISDYDVTRVDLDAKHDSATVTVDVSWSIKQRGLLERTVVEEKWAYRNGDWVMTKESRVKGSALPIFDEPEAKAAAKAQ